MLFGAVTLYNLDVDGLLLMLRAKTCSSKGGRSCYEIIKCLLFVAVLQFMAGTHRAKTFRLRLVQDHPSSFSRSHR